MEGVLHGGPVSAPRVSVLERVHLFPVRHHSPRTSAVLRAFLDHVRPEIVLVEGPSDATSLIELLVDPETRPPVAILGFRTDGVPASSVWPFAAYSPEYVALRWAAVHRVRAAFIDIPVGHSLSRVPPEEQDDAAATAVSSEASPASLSEQCAAARGFRSFEEFWEASFEAPSYDPAAFREALLAYADLVRSEGDRTIHRVRDACMARNIVKVVESGIAPEKVAVVLGAAHAAALTAGAVDPGFEEGLPAPVESAVTLIPYSFPRLAEQLGYGAGNRAPQYYQRAHEAGCDFKRATLEALLEFAEHLRFRGFMASLADTIEAYRLAVLLADMRGKAAPGLDEVREAAVATLCRGEATHIDGFLWATVVGKNVGRVASRIGRNSLQEEFWLEVRERRLPATDAPERFVLKLNNHVEVGTSVFLHRLRVASVPYAVFQGTKGGVAVSASTAEPAGGHTALSRVREVWEAQWTPSTDVALVEKIVLGSTLQEVVTRLLEQKLSDATTTGAAADVESSGSRPAITCRTAATSATLRPNGPIRSSEEAKAIRPYRETRP